MNLEQEERNGYLISRETKKLWNVQLQLLDKLLEVCKKYDITVWAGGGTQLGAIRHKGYIPWDDDIDICMLRSSFDKLLEIGQKEFKHPYYLQTNYNEHDFPVGVAKLRMDGTSFIVENEAFQDYHQGIFIDLVPLDAFPDSPEEYEKFKKKALEMREHLYISCYFKGTTKLNPFLWYKYIVGKINVFLNGGFYNYHRKYINLFRSYSTEDNEYVGSLTLDFDMEHFHFKRSIFNDTIWVPFEDRMIPVPADYDEFLTSQYGDYMTPVKAPSLHEADHIYIDTERSYTEWLPEVRRQRKRDRKGKIKKMMIKLFHIK